MSNSEKTPRRGRQAAVGLGLLGLGLGLGQLLAPRALARVLGVRDGALAKGLLRGLGARQLVVAVGLLAGKRSKPWLWARVAGDVVDLALLGAAVRAEPTHRGASSARSPPSGA